VGGGRAGTVEHGEFDEAGEFGGFVPAVELGELVGAENPDEPGAGPGGAEPAHGVDGVVNATGAGFEVEEAKAWFGGFGKGKLKQVEAFSGGSDRGVAEGGLGGGNEEEVVEVQAVQGGAGDGEMAEVNGVEGAAKEADAGVRPY
jgi:hypothetical protein